MLSTLPHTGIRGVARKTLLEEFINVLQSSKNLEEKILATLAIKTFITDPSKFSVTEPILAQKKFSIRRLKKGKILLISFNFSSHLESYPYTLRSVNLELLSFRNL